MTTMLKPGFLVSLKTALRGNVSYNRKDLETTNGGKEEISRWETTRTIVDKAEYEEAIQTRNGINATIRRECSATTFGLLCPLSNEEGLKDAINSARATAREFNAKANYTYVEFFVLKGRIAETDEEATRAIADEVNSLLRDMKEGIVELDPKKIRQAATQAKALNTMLTQEDSEKVAGAIQAARKAARDIVRRVEKAGEDSQSVLFDISTQPIDDARFTFLDLDADVETEGETLPPVAVDRFAGLELWEEEGNNDAV